MLVCFLMPSCTALKMPKTEKQTYQTDINAPKGSYVKPFTKSITSNTHDYTIFLNHNYGEHRQNIETALIKIPLISNPKISFTLKADDSLISLKTPIKLIEITDNNNQTRLSLNLKQTIYWLETQHYYKKIPLFLEQRPEKFMITQNNHKIILTIGNMSHEIPIDNTDNLLKIGMIRSDLFRYRGLVVPAQTLYVKNLIFLK